MNGQPPRDEFGQRLANQVMFSPRQRRNLLPPGTEFASAGLIGAGLVAWAIRLIVRDAHLSGPAIELLLGVLLFNASWVGHKWTISGRSRPIIVGHLLCVAAAAAAWVLIVHGVGGVLSHGTAAPAVVSVGLFLHSALFVLGVSSGTALLFEGPPRVFGQDPSWAVIVGFLVISSAFSAAAILVFLVRALLSP